VVSGKVTSILTVPGFISVSAFFTTLSSAEYIRKDTMPDGSFFMKKQKGLIYQSELVMIS
jgi:hypothetical protein